MDIEAGPLQIVDEIVHRLGAIALIPSRTVQVSDRSADSSWKMSMMPSRFTPPR